MVVFFCFGKLFFWGEEGSREFFFLIYSSRFWFENSKIVFVVLLVMLVGISVVRRR